MEELNPCPICENKVEIHGGPEEWKPTFYDPDSGGDPYCVQCGGCGMKLQTDTHEYDELIEKWNHESTILLKLFGEK